MLNFAEVYLPLNKTDHQFPNIGYISDVLRLWSQNIAYNHKSNLKSLQILLNNQKKLYTLTRLIAAANVVLKTNILLFLKQKHERASVVERPIRLSDFTPLDYYLWSKTCLNRPDNPKS